MRLHIRVIGRPAPQGSKHLLGAGQFAESSAYLPAWRVAVRIGCYRAYAGAGIVSPSLPVFPAPEPVHIEQLTFLVGEDQCRAEGTDQPTGTPDIDKLLRATLDALGGGAGETARLFEDDSQVMQIGLLRKTRPIGTPPGAIIIVSNEGI